MPLRALVRSADDAARLSFTPAEIVVADLLEGVPEGTVRGVSAVLYLAATSVPADSPRDPAGEFARGLPALNGVLAALAREGGGRIVFPSSGGSVYGERAEPAGETAPTAPRSAYALGKLLGEQTIAFWNRTAGVGFDVLRLTNVYGSPTPRARPQGVIDVFLDDALAGRTSRVWGPLAVERDFLFVDDAAEAVVRAALTARSSDGVYNVGFDETHALSEVLALVAEATGGDHRWIAEGGHDAGVNRSAVDAAAFRRDFGWRPQTGLGDGVRETWRRKLAMKERSARPTSPSLQVTSPWTE